jgi:hypothetical protein
MEIMQADDDAVRLIQMEYAEMTDMKLTFEQMRRLWNLSDERCERVLGLLTGSGFLVQARDGRYVRGSVSSADERRRERL